MLSISRSPVMRVCDVGGFVAFVPIIWSLMPSGLS